MFTVYVIAIYVNFLQKSEYMWFCIAGPSIAQYSVHSLVEAVQLLQSKCSHRACYSIVGKSRRGAAITSVSLYLYLCLYLYLYF